MSALTIASTAYPQVESLGSLKLIIVPLTGLSTSDTYSIEANSPVVASRAQPTIGSTSTSVIDVSFVQSTGVFTISTVTNYGAFNLFILMRT